MTDWKKHLFEYLKEPGPSIRFAGYLHSRSFLVIKHQRLEKARVLAHSTKLTALFAKSAYRHKIYSVALEENTTAINNRCIKFTLWLLRTQILFACCTNCTRSPSVDRISDWSIIFLLLNRSAGVLDAFEESPFGLIRQFWHSIISPTPVRQIM